MFTPAKNMPKTLYLEYFYNNQNSRHEIIFIATFTIKILYITINLSLYTNVTLDKIDLISKSILIPALLNFM